ncbi:DUF397 domain-containing protein [Streptomyces sp. 15-116A]|uniref:DUF397 domain-containing protein n=1 Tax=Streptomyces sp. 15-116A TaxID=2259035 RepID=UPI0021B1CC2B|nr:DUF397 domain-containing protein [Streptomyces sp. 15-116A]MCT7351233.1 DUF397 domain-containing protein [Streptomyces sp. 15-116A]
MNWRKSTYSDGGDGDTCVEIAELPGRIAIRDSKAPTRAALSFPASSFVDFIEDVKRGSESRA